MARSAGVAAGPEADPGGPILHQFSQVTVTPAPAGALQRQPAAPSTIKCGDVTLDPQAQADFNAKKPFFSGKDNNFLSLDKSGKLCMDESNKVPEDPFRWQHLKDILDNGHAEIFSVTRTTPFQIRDLKPQTKLTSITFDTHIPGEGFTLMRPDVDRTINGQNARLTGLSPKDSHDRVYYTKLDSLAHEFFGHLWLATEGVPYQHPPTVQDKRDEAAEKGKPAPTKLEEEATAKRLQDVGTLTAAHGVKDPFGRPFTGTVFQYIHYLAGNDPVTGKSQTQGIGTSLAVIAVNELRFAFTSDQTKTPPATDYTPHWDRVSANYDALLSGQSRGTSLVTPTWLKQVVVELVRDEMTEPQRTAFHAFLTNSTSQLAKDVLREVPAPAAAPTP